MASSLESAQPLDRLATLDFNKIKAELDSKGKIGCPTPTCSENFKSIWGLKFHLKKNSCDSPKFKCDKCDGAFQSRILLQQHDCDSAKEDTADKKRLNKCSTKETLTPNKGAKELNVPQNKAKSSRISANNPYIESSGTNQGPPAKQKDSLQIISKENRRHVSSSSKEHSVVKDGMQKQIGNSSDVQNVLNVKRKRGRTRQSENLESVQSEESDNVGTSIKDIKPSLRKHQSTGETLAFPKRKRGRPRKTGSPEDKTSGKSQSDSSELNKDPRTSGVDSAQEENMNGNCGSVSNYQKKPGSSTLQGFATPKKKRGRPPKAETTRARPRKVMTDRPSSVDVAKRNSMRSASKKKVNYAEKEHVDSDDESNPDEDEDDDDDDDDDDSESAKRPKLNASNDADDDDDDDEEADGDGVATKTPKSAKKKEMTEKQKLLDSLKKQLKTGKISCANNCGKKFASIAGYNFHLEICGKERSIIKCDVCAKEYTTQAGLKYHMNAIHTEPEPKEETNEDKKEETEHQETSIDGTEDASKRPRRAASRAKKKFREIEEEQKKVATSCKKSGYGSRSLALDQHIKKLRNDIITPALMRTIKQQLRTRKEAVCPNKECQQPFRSPIAFKNHYLRCGFDSCPFSCLLCGLEYNSIDGARSHVEKFHGKDVGEDSPNEGEASESEDEDSDDSENGDVDYKKGTDEESNEEEDDDDDDYDDLEEDESEGVPSEEDEEDDDKKKPLKGDKCRKKYQMDKQNITRKGDMVLFVGRWNKNFREFEKWRKQNFSKKECFAEQITGSLDHWSRVQNSDVSNYLPTSTQSPHFRITRPNIAQHQDTLDTQLPVFTGLPKDDSGIHGDRIIYTGGPVWELSWCPTPDGKEKANQYLVANSHKSFGKVHSAYECQKDQGLLQVWNVGVLSNTSSSSGETPTLALAIAHDYGPVWKISWCPSGVWQSPSPTVDEDKNLSRLGLMALACGDGIVRVISVPHPDELLSRLGDSSNVEANETEPTSSVSKVMVHCEPHMELYPCPLNVPYSGRRGQALCVEWSVVEPFDKVAAGFSDGTLVVWNLLTQSPLLRKSTGKRQMTLRLAPIIFIKAHSSLLKDLAFCPCDVDFLVTGGHDRSYKVWDLKSPISPVFVAKKGSPYEVDWPFCSNGFLYCEDVVFYNNEPTVRLLTLAGLKPSPRVFFRFPSSTFTLSYNSWINLIASGDVGGNITLAKMTSSGQEKWPLYKTTLEDLAASSETADSTGEETSNLKEKSRSLVEETRTSRIVFEDENTLQFRFLVSKKNKELEEKPTSVRCNSSTLQAIHKVRWNPNKQALTWIATGGASGLVRIHHVRQVEPNQLKDDS